MNAPETKVIRIRRSNFQTIVAYAADHMAQIEKAKGLKKDSAILAHVNDIWENLRDDNATIEVVP